MTVENMNFFHQLQQPQVFMIDLGYIFSILL